ncbi:MAG: hypothetical protein LBU17_08320, partial [Treponema sp.]|nr:hypothetical protein [Treponema sp.]
MSEPIDVNPTSYLKKKKKRGKRPGDGDWGPANPAAIKRGLLFMIESGYYTAMRLKNFVLLVVFSNLFLDCAAMKGISDLNTLPENSLRGNPSNTVNAIEYVSEVLVHPAGREIIAYNRRVFNANNPKGKIFNYHSFYVFLKDGQFEHTLVFSDTPRGSKYKECWMLDAKTDVDSYNLFIYSDNPWDVEEYVGPNGETTLNV